MEQGLPLAITISRQLGSGGSYIGQRLASKLNMLYLDREIIKNAAEKLGILEKDLEGRDEKLISRWEYILNSLTYSQPEIYTLPERILPSNKEIFQAEKDIILKVASESRAVIIGRGGSHILRDHARHVSIFLHADIEFRKKRLQDLYGVSSQEAEKSIESIDRSRARFIRELTGSDLYDTRQYHLSIDTGALGLDRAEHLITEYLTARFGNIL
jgi:cytidylate kinase